MCDPPKGAAPDWFRNRGYRFEALLNDLLRADDLDPRTSYRTKGEQIDGSFVLDGKTYLLEAKWHGDEMPASAVYQFKGKVDGKLIGTIVVFISMSGYSEDAVDALSLGKTLNVILFDKHDIDIAITGDAGFKAVFRQKLRHAAEDGVVFFPAESELVTSTGQNAIQSEQPKGAEPPPAPKHPPSLIIICEGERDRRVLGLLAQRILQSLDSETAIKIVAARGKYTVPGVANGLRMLHPRAKFLIVIDSDGAPEQALEMLKQRLEFTGWQAIVVEPELETWLGLDKRALQGSRDDITSQILGQAAAIDIDSLRDTDRAFQEFFKAIAESETPDRPQREITDN